MSTKASPSLSLNDKEGLKMVDFKLFNSVYRRLCGWKDLYMENEWKVDKKILDIWLGKWEDYYNGIKLNESNATSSLLRYDWGLVY